MLLSRTPGHLTLGPAVRLVANTRPVHALPMARTLPVTPLPGKTSLTLAKPAFCWFLVTVHTCLGATKPHPAWVTVDTERWVLHAVTEASTATVGVSGAVRDFTAVAHPARVAGALVESSVALPVASTVFANTCVLI